MNRPSAYRTFFADLITSNAGVRRSEPALVRAFASTPREHFVGRGPWKVFTPQGYLDTPSDDPVYLYQDVTVALNAAKSINNGQPSLHALCIGTLQVRPGQRVIHVGTGTGYYTAILADLVGPTGRVFGFEIDESLAKRAAENLKASIHVTIYDRSGAEGVLPESDVIYVNAGATDPLDIWLDALLPGGRLLFPLTASAGSGGMLLITKTGDYRFAARFISAVMFIPCIGARDEEVGARLADAFRRGDHRQVRWLHRDSQPDGANWCYGRTWWLSKAIE